MLKMKYGYYANEIRLVVLPIHWIWAPMLIGWGAKTLALKHDGGMRTYRKFLPFFLGLILDDFFMGGFWGLIDLSSNAPGYLIFP